MSDTRVLRPRQAVLLTRVSPGAGDVYALDAPVMTEIAGRPFLAYVVDLLRQEGFTDALLLTGAAGTVAREYFGTGDTMGVRLSYSIVSGSVSPPAQAHEARTTLHEHFLLLNADTYWPMRFDAMWREYLVAGLPAMATVYGNRDGYARDTVKVGGGLVERFDPSGMAPGHGSMVGYAILRRDALDLMAPDGPTVEQALYPPLVERKALAVYPTEHRFYGVSTPQQLALTRIFLARKPAIILDADGVLNRRPLPGDYIKSAAEFEWLPGALEALRAFREAGYTVIVASNHAGLARGHVSVEALEAIHDLMRRQAREAGGGIDAIYQCPHAWYAGCDCRKPRPGLLLQAQRDFSLDLTRTPVLGDETAMRAAAAAGAEGRLVTSEKSLLAHARDILHLPTLA